MIKGVRHVSRTNGTTVKKLAVKVVYTNIATYRSTLHKTSVLKTPILSNALLKATKDINLNASVLEIG